MAVPFYIAPDHLGSPHQITDSSGAVVWLWRPDPFGNGDPMGAFSYELRFPGQYFDQATKLHYNYFRDYDPRTGRYIESDPIGLAGGINTYAYVGGNPVNLTDPLGLTPGTDSSPSREIGGIVEGIYNHFCSPDGGGKPPVDCGEVLKKCREKCLDIFVNNPGGLPGTGRDYFGRMRRCTRECMEANGCPDF